MNTLICIEEIISDVTSVLDKPIERTRFEVIDPRVWELAQEKIWRSRIKCINECL